ncbi:lysozyme inhibitor LprI family protein [Pseudomonas sp.]|uniref:lysozyme inhibitor LprI family protein n=1 Tax=Pseudomonas sp. TaxID=306 RepID=UPI002620F1F1|nr:lysozyme inhibitor LprI family protein [Pseudomonas sp.]
MKSILLALALITTGVQAADDADYNPCNAVENDQQTLACSAFSRHSAEQLLTENYEALQARMTALYGANPTQLNNITSKIKSAQALWLHQRDADCAIAVFPNKAGTQAFTIAQNDCIGGVSDDRSEFLESIGQD